MTEKHITYSLACIMHPKGAAGLRPPPHPTQIEIKEKLQTQ